MENNLTESQNPKDKLDQILEFSQKAFASAEKTRKYMLWSMIIQVGMIVLPLIGLLIAIPFFLNNLTNTYQGLL